MRVSMRQALSAVLILVLASLGGQAVAEVKLPALFSDHMVLQRGMELPVWGSADAGATVTVAIGPQKATATADADGRWQVRLKPMEAGGPHTMTVQGGNTLTVSDILVGEVWVCSGQSNMQMAVRSSRDAQQEIAAANFPQVRLLSVRRVTAEKPLPDIQGQWAACSPETVPGFSAVAYFFGRELHKALNVPIGLINTSWGGTPSEAWTSQGTVDAVPEFQPIVERFKKAIADYPKTKENWEKNRDQRLARWEAAVEKAKAEGKRAPRRPQPPGDPRQSPHRPTSLYNGMIAPLVPCGIAGAIWYQGESNAGRAFQYRTIFPAMIADWRKAWGQGDFPFLFVQLANFRARQPEPGPSSWAELREAQSMTLGLPKTGQAVIIDIGAANDIHPKNKQDVGKRLALAARAIAYGENIVFSGPVYDSMKADGNKVRLTFKHVGGGLVAKGGESLNGFAVAGEDQKFVWADATIDGSTVVVSSSQVANPVAVRYGWAENPDCNLYNKEGLPASPFRTDQWPGITVNSK